MRRQDSLGSCREGDPFRTVSLWDVHYRRRRPIALVSGNARWSEPAPISDIDPGIGGRAPLKRMDKKQSAEVATLCTYSSTSDGKSGFGGAGTSVNGLAPRIQRNRPSCLPAIHDDAVDFDIRLHTVRHDDRGWCPFLGLPAGARFELAGAELPRRRSPPLD